MGSQESPGKDASLSKDTTFPELAASQDDNDSSCSCGGDTRESSAFPKAFEQELLSPIGSDASPASGEGQPSPGQPSPAQQQPVVGDLTPIAEATQASDPTLAQTVCDNKAAQDLAQSDTPAPQTSDDPLTNEKKRTTSVTFDLTGEGEEASTDAASENNMQETRKQKVSQGQSFADALIFISNCVWRVMSVAYSVRRGMLVVCHSRTATAERIVVIFIFNGSFCVGGSFW